MINASVRIHTGHIQVQAKGYQEKKSMRLVVPDPSAVGELMDGIPEVDVYTFRANAFSLASSRERTYGILVIGSMLIRQVPGTNPETFLWNCSCDEAIL